jgi:hypothetical protein
MNARNRALQLVDEGLVDPMTMLEACLKYMSLDDVEDMIHCNEMEPEIEYDGQPDEQQEWHDFDPDC